MKRQVIRKSGPLYLLRIKAGLGAAFVGFWAYEVRGLGPRHAWTKVCTA